MELEIQYKLDTNATDWSVMSIPLSVFNHQWDDEEISMEIMEYVYTNLDSYEDDIEDQCVVNNMLNLITIVKNYFREEHRLDIEHKEDFYRSCH